LRYFDLIVPCGIQDARPTSLEHLLGRTVETGEVKTRLGKHFAHVFGSSLEPVSRRELEAILNGRRARTATEPAAAAV
jgi:lipoate-protein ligase B